MTDKERTKLIRHLKYNRSIGADYLITDKDADEIIKALEQEPCEMTAEEYRQRMIQAFHNADCDELIAICSLPTEKEFEHLEWLLKTHYKKEPSEDCISRQAVLALITEYQKGFDAVMNIGGKVSMEELADDIKLLNSSVTPQPKTGHWVSIDEEPHEVYECDRCGRVVSTFTANIEPHIEYKYCPNCGAKMIEPQESEDKE